jgi:hypothetical protein
LWHCNVKNISIKNVEAKEQNLKKDSVAKNRNIKIYQDICPFHHKTPSALRIMKENFHLHDKKMPKTSLLEEVYSDFDNFHKQLYNKQKNDNTKVMMQKIFDI